jgi:hypothetical protein
MVLLTGAGKLVDKHWRIIKTDFFFAGLQVFIQRLGLNASSFVVLRDMIAKTIQEEFAARQVKPCPTL